MPTTVDMLSFETTIDRDNEPVMLTTTVVYKGPDGVIGILKSDGLDNEAITADLEDQIEAADIVLA